MQDKRRLVLLVLAAALAWTGGLLLAESRCPDVEVVTLRPDQLPSFHPRRSGSATMTLGSRCTEGSVAPDPTWTCVNSVWTASTTPNIGGVGPGRASGCVTAPPANQMTCIGGVWMMPANTAGPSGGQTGSNAGSPPASATSGSTAPGPPPAPMTPCVGTPPITGTGQTVACENGVWVIR
jgi:hypothetical protein